MNQITRLAPTDAAIGLRARARALPDMSEVEVLGVVDSTVVQYEGFGLFKTAWDLGSEIVAKTRAFAAHVTASPHPKVRLLVYAFLAAIAGELYDHVMSSTEVFHRVEAMGERAVRELVCSLMSIVRQVRREAHCRTALV